MEMKTTNEIAQEALTEISHLPRDVLSESAWRDQATAIITKAIQAAQGRGEPTESERMLFEAWMRGHCWPVIGDWGAQTYAHKHESNGLVHAGAMDTRRLWAAWRDRAALGSPSKRHPLSDQQIINLMPTRISAQHDGDLMLFARAIESAINTNTP